MSDSKTAAIAHIALESIGNRPKKVLVVRCGSSGVEAAILQQEFQAEVTGIDIENRFDRDAARQVNLRVDDAMEMSFGDRSFDFVYSYHALGHIRDYRKALQEMRRVLAPGGSWCIGTPHRSRLLGYLRSKNATLQQKIRWNTIDWKKQIQGQFRNECGAHAGFTASELCSHLTSAFDSALDVTVEYYRSIYPSHKRKIDLVGLVSADFFFPQSISWGR
jgi:ubiquinone/menaquinone biosynthesis C-methylase UbiE